MKDLSKERKKKNCLLLNKKGIRVNINLPLIESDLEVKIRKPKEVAQRLIILTIQNFVCNGTELGQARGMITHHNLIDYVTPNEINFFNGEYSQSQISQESWKCEGMLVLFWALGIAKELPFPENMATILDHINKEDYPIINDKDPNELINSDLKLRSTAEILDMADLYYRIYWACVDDRLKGQQTPGVVSGVVYERLYALNWLINYMGSAWDDVSCDT